MEFYKIPAVHQVNGDGNDLNEEVHPCFSCPGNTIKPDIGNAHEHEAKAYHTQHGYSFLYKFFSLSEEAEEYGWENIY